MLGSCGRSAGSCVANLARGVQAMFVDFGMAQQYGGRCYLRFDDTNPEAEKQEFIDHIQDIVSWLGWMPWKVLPPPCRCPASIRRVVNTPREHCGWLRWMPWKGLRCCHLSLALCCDRAGASGFPSLAPSALPAQAACRQDAVPVLRRA